MAKQSYLHLAGAKSDLWEHAADMSELTYGKRTLSHVFRMSMNPQFRKHSDKVVARVQDQIREYQQCAAATALHSKSAQIAAALRDLQLMDDPDNPKKYLFRVKAQWRVIFEVLRDHHLLPTTDPNDFCDILDDPSDPRHFLPHDHFNVGHEQSHYCKGVTLAHRRRAGNSTYHVITNSVPLKPSRQEATTSAFEQLLRHHGVI